jgi:signal transduction histidine kinase
MGTFGDEGVKVPTKSEQEYLIAMASHMAVAFDRIRLLAEQKENEEELKEAQRIGHLGSFEWDAKTDEARGSSEFYNIYGADPSMKAPPFSEYIKLHTPESIEILTRASDTLRNTGEPDNLDLELIRPDGSRRWVNFRAEARYDEKHNFIGVRGTVQDITKAKEVEKMRVDFLSLASHQLRTPLSGTKWLIETLEKKIPGPLTKNQEEYLEEIHGINERMTRLVSDMLTALRVESSESIIAKKIIPVEQLFSDLMFSVEAAAKSRKIVINNRASQHPVPKIESDENFLSIILSTFLSNAINYSEDGKEVVFDIVAEDGGVAFSVQDFGIGIPLEEQVHVYERFFRAMNAKMVRPEGTGLGLYIANIIADKLDGKITFTSEIGKGTTFVLHLPFENVK